MKMVSQRNQPFYPIRHQTMFESVLEHFANLQHVKRGKTYVSGLNAVFVGTEVAKTVSQRKQPFYPSGPQTMFESVSEHFANLWDVKRGKICVRASLPYFGVPNCENGIATKSSILPPLDPKLCMRVFRSISQTSNMSNEAKLVFRA